MLGSIWAHLKPISINKSPAEKSQTPRACHSLSCCLVLQDKMTQDQSSWWYVWQEPCIWRTFFFRLSTCIITRLKSCYFIFLVPRKWVETVWRHHAISVAAWGLVMLILIISVLLANTNPDLHHHWKCTLGVFCFRRINPYLFTNMEWHKYFRLVSISQNIPLYKGIPMESC